MNILIVDDQAESRSLLTAILAGEGYSVRAADGGELALASLAVSRPDLILLDIRMPEMDGFEVCRRIKNDPQLQDIPVMFLSASQDLAERVEGLRLGAVDHVSKPFQREELLARVQTHLELHRLRTQLEAKVAERTAELQESEERFRLMADAAPALIWAAGPNKQVNFFNKGWLAFRGRTLAEESGMGWTSGVHPDDLEYCYRTYSSSFDARRSFEMEYRLQRADGEYRWVLDKGVPRLLPGDAFAGYIGCCVDVTDLKQYHSRLHAAQKMESLGLMAAGVAHDFGNVLGAMLGEIDLALTEAPSETPGYDSIQRLEGLTMHASEMVRLLRESAGGSVDANPMEPLDLSYQVEQVLRLMNVSIAKHAHIRSKLQKNLPAVCGHVTTLRQLIVNLVANAAEALEGKEGSIEVTTDCMTLRAPPGGSNFQNMPEGEYVRLAVSDTGRGMTSETRARIFDPFFTTKTSGRGLGLAVVHGIVRSHGGAINVTSAVDTGTTFEVLFPTVRDREKEPSDAFPV